MKKITKLLSIFLLIFASLSVYAYLTPIQVLVKCSGILKPVVNENVAISTTSETPGKITRIEYKTTDSNGYFYINESYHGKFIEVYLAGNRSIIVDCRSRLMPIKAGELVLGELGSTCPASFCQ